MGCVGVNDAPIKTAEALACVRCAYGSGSLDSTFTRIQLGKDAAKGAIDFPDEGYLLSHFQIKLTNMAGGPGTITSRVTWDTDGDCYISNQDSDAILVGMTTATDGGCVINYAAPGAPMKRPLGLGTKGKLELWLMLDVGTADVEVWAYFRPATACG